MITGKKEELDDIVGKYVCKDDGGHLTTAWHGIPEGFKGIDAALERSPTPQELKDGGCYVLRCQYDHYPEEVTPQLSLSQMYKQGEELPEPIQSNVKKAIEKRAQRLPQAPQAETFTGIPAADLGTGELLPVTKLQALVSYARKYDLDPARGHVALMYGEPYITLDGYLYHANRTRIPYSLTTRPLDDDERGQYQIPEGAHAWLSKVVRADTGTDFTGLGIITLVEINEESKKKPGSLANPVIHSKPWQMCQKRADWQALRRAFPIGETEPGEEVKT